MDTVVPPAPKPAPPVEEPVKTHRGIDVSHWNGDEVKEITPEDSLTFIICKSTQGTSIVDPDFAQNWKLIGEKGTLRGCYHFYLVNADPAAQAKHFYATVSAQGKTDLPLIVDIEQGSMPSGTKVDPAKVKADLLTFIKTLQGLDTRTPMIYTGLSFANQYLNDPVFAQYPLWLADYTKAAQPPTPTAWKDKGWKIWQKNDDYDINSQPTDYDVFVGRKSDLLK
jgi:lysozyme